MQTTGKKCRWAILGGGNGGQSAAGHLALMGYPVILYDIFEETVAAINCEGGIHLSGVVEGFGELQGATTKLEHAVPTADVVMVITPALAHAEIARGCAPLLRDGQVVVLHPGATGGALEFAQVLRESGCRAEVSLAETNSLIYACRSTRPAHATIYGIKHDLKVAALPARDNERVLSFLADPFPQIKAARNVLETSLANPNAMMHPAPTLLNTGRIESDQSWLYYWDGITPSIARFVSAMDAERLAIARALDVHLPSILDWYGQAYGAHGKDLKEAVRNNSAYADIQGQHSLETRYLLEDVPLGLVPMLALGEALGVRVPHLRTIVDLAQLLLQKDLTSTGRTLKRLGLEGMDRDQIVRFVETGERGAGG
ncbi:opine dehydrogenase [Desulfacinum hydrothermale DSM 13146]|uniref:2-dehydropantoate 2-reductase n=2 Tax=Desulfacinum hydrothermale TaxID=109258 RepID=A0A1W1XF31_9BACT|nr:opine dehydrogenase [Desulfacinum hydrothermale DSM 13146]